MNFEKFSIGFPHIAHFPLDNEGRYFAMTKPLRIWDGETDKYTKFKSLREMWDHCFDGTHKVSDWFAGVNSFDDDISLSGGRGSGSGSGANKTFGFGNAPDEKGGGDARSVPRHFPVEANTNIKTKTQENAIKYFAKQYRNADHEYGMVIDKQGFVHEYQEGARSSVAIGAKKGAMVVHNHPGGGAFSKNDMLHAARTNSAGIVAIGSKGGDYYFKKTGHFKSAAFERAVKNAKMKGKDYDDAVRNWLGDKNRQKKLGFRFEFKKKRK